MQYKLHPAAAELFKMVVLQEYRTNNVLASDQRKELSLKIEEQETILANARKKFMKDEIDLEDFRIIKLECNEELRKLEAQLSDLKNKKGESKNIESLLDIALEKFSNIDTLYKNADIERKRRLFGSIFPEKVCFDGTRHRTARNNEALSLILLIKRNT